MNELRLFKKSFFMGRLIWVVGSKKKTQIKRLRMTLKHCQIQPGEILTVGPHQFIDMLSKGVSNSLLRQYEVVVVRGFENLEPHLAGQFLKHIQNFKDLQMGLAMRMILVSSKDIPSELNNFETFKPIQISFKDENEDPGDLNLRVHVLIEKAIKVSGVSVVRLSPRAGVFLEYYSTRTSSADVLELIILGLQRSDRRVLRLRDFLPNLFPTAEDLNGA